MLTRILFALLALGALYGLVSSPEMIVLESEDSPQVLVLTGLLITCLGMVVSWRSFRLDSPGRNLAFVSKLLGWAGANGVPLAVSSGNIVAVVVCVLLPLCAFALWSKRSWAAWPWYAVALACLGPAFWGLYVLLFMFLFRFTVGGLSEGVCFGMMTVRTLFWGSISVALMRELTAWRRGLGSPGEARSSTPAS